MLRPLLRLQLRAGTVPPPPTTWIERVLSRWYRAVLFNGNGRCPYMLRWQIWTTARIKVYVHKFIADDWSTDLHDHSSRFWSIGVKGSYAEDTPTGTRVYRAPWVRTFPADHRHRVRILTPTVWTVVVTGPFRRRGGFWVDGRWIPTNEYRRSPRANTAAAC